MKRVPVYNGGKPQDVPSHYGYDHGSSRTHEKVEQMVRAPPAATAAARSDGRQDLGDCGGNDREYDRLVEAAAAAAEAEGEADGVRNAAVAKPGVKPSLGLVKPRNAELTKGGNPGSFGGSSRDDWSEDATRALLSAWGERFLRLSRGSLKLEDWMEVARIVSGCCLAPKTEVQCKNRVDTLKKKFKSEKHKVETSGGVRSKWPFYYSLERLLTLGRDDQQQHEGLPGAIDAGEMVRPRRAAGCLGSDDEDDDRAAEGSSEGSEGDKRRKRRKVSRGRSIEDDEEDEGGALRELSNAIERFGEIYERMESSKQQQMADLALVRMEFARDLELHRMQLSMQTQIEVARVKHPDVDEAGMGSVLAGINIENSTNF